MVRRGAVGRHAGGGGGGGAVGAVGGRRAPDEVGREATVDLAARGGG